MPRQPCTKGGKRGQKWGSKGKCYTGPGAAVKADRQGRAVKSRQTGRSKR